MADTALGASAPATEEPGPLDLHDLYRLQHSAGYHHKLTLLPHEAQRIAANLRGLSAINSILIASSDSQSMVLGEWLSGGLFDAIGSLIDNTQIILDRNCDIAHQQAQGEKA